MYITLLRYLIFKLTDLHRDYHGNKRTRHRVRHVVTNDTSSEVHLLSGRSRVDSVR